MNSEIKISIIVPIYNVEQYIERCTRSLMEQTLLEGIEYIFVNDATPDNSMAILKRVVSEYPKRKDQVRIIDNPQNLGITASRSVELHRLWRDKSRAFALSKRISYN